MSSICYQRACSSHRRKPRSQNIATSLNTGAGSRPASATGADIERVIHPNTCIMDDAVASADSATKRQSPKRKTILANYNRKPKRTGGMFNIIPPVPVIEDPFNVRVYSHARVADTRLNRRISVETYTVAVPPIETAPEGSSQGNRSAEGRWFRLTRVSA